VLLQMRPVQCPDADGSDDREGWGGFEVLGGAGHTAGEASSCVGVWVFNDAGWGSSLWYGRYGMVLWVGEVAIPKVRYPRLVWGPRGAVAVYLGVCGGLFVGSSGG
jgi:hypothetical protein